MNEQRRDRKYKNSLQSSDVEAVGLSSRPRLASPSRARQAEPVLIEFLPPPRAVSGRGSCYRREVTRQAGWAAAGKAATSPQGDQGQSWPRSMPRR